MTEIVLDRTEVTVETIQPASAVISVSPAAPVTVSTSTSGPQGVPGTTPIYTRVGELAPLIGQGRFYFETACVVGRVRASVGTAPTGAPVLIDVNVNGSSIYADGSQRPSIAPGTHTVTSIPAFSVAAGDYITVDIDSVGTTNPGADLTVTVSIA